jgi:hypothetical protein
MVIFNQVDVGREFGLQWSADFEKNKNCTLLHTCTAKTTGTSVRIWKLISFFCS